MVGVGEGRGGMGGAGSGLRRGGPGAKMGHMHMAVALAGASGLTRLLPAYRLAANPCLRCQPLVQRNRPAGEEARITGGQGVVLMYASELQGRTSPEGRGRARAPHEVRANDNVEMLWEEGNTPQVGVLVPAIVAGKGRQRRPMTRKKRAGSIADPRLLQLVSAARSGLQVLMMLHACNRACTHWCPCRHNKSSSTQQSVAFYGRNCGQGHRTASALTHVRLATCVYCPTCAPPCTNASPLGRIRESPMRWRRPSGLVSMIQLQKPS